MTPLDRHLSTSSNRVLLAMSGGIDSSVAAYILKEQGYDVVGMSMQLMTCHRQQRASCCSSQDRMDARQICDELNIPFYVLDYHELFKEKVINPFIDEYLQGRTPSPCVLCNDYLKFGALFLEADRINIPYIATGHYCMIETNQFIGNVLCDYAFKQGIDSKKDQSYFLYMLNQQQLSRLLFPVGSYTKIQVRKMAQDYGLAIQQKPESQEICFVTDNDYVSYIESNASSRLSGPGHFKDLQGNILGQHRGLHAYTIGQRRGLGFGVGRRLYVVRIDSTSNIIYLGDKSDLESTTMTVHDVRWVDEKFKSVNRARVKIRSTQPGHMASIYASDHAVKVVFDAPQYAIAPGQAAVFYHDDYVLGGGWINA